MLLQKVSSEHGPHDIAPICQDPPVRFHTSIVQLKNNVRVVLQLTIPPHGLGEDLELLEKNRN